MNIKRSIWVLLLACAISASAMETLGDTIDKTQEEMQLMEEQAKVKAEIKAFFDGKTDLETEVGKELLRMQAKNTVTVDDLLFGGGQQTNYGHQGVLNAIGEAIDLAVTIMKVGGDQDRKEYKKHWNKLLTSLEGLENSYDSVARFTEISGRYYDEICKLDAELTNVKLTKYTYSLYRIVLLFNDIQINPKFGIKNIIEYDDLRNTDLDYTREDVEDAIKEGIRYKDFPKWLEERRKEKQESSSSSSPAVSSSDDENSRSEGSVENKPWEEKKKQSSSSSSSSSSSED